MNLQQKAERSTMKPIHLILAGLIAISITTCVVEGVDLFLSTVWVVTGLAAFSVTRLSTVASWWLAILTIIVFVAVATALVIGPVEGRSPSEIGGLRAIGVIVIVSQVAACLDWAQRRPTKV